jgi:hypothetical protein
VLAEEPLFPAFITRPAGVALHCVMYCPAATAISAAITSEGIAANIIELAELLQRS